MHSSGESHNIYTGGGGTNKLHKNGARRGSRLALSCFKIKRFINIAVMLYIYERIEGANEVLPLPLKSIKV